MSRDFYIIFLIWEIGVRELMVMHELACNLTDQVNSFILVEQFYVMERCSLGGRKILVAIM